MNHRRILVLGANGGTGRLVVEQAIERGHEVAAFLRPGRPPPGGEGVEVIEGEVVDPEALRAAMEGRDAVVSCLGISRRNAANPWTSFLSPPDFMERVASGIVEAMKAAGLSRLVAISVGGAGDSRTRCDAPTRLLFRISKLQQTVVDAERMEAVLAESGLDWYAARPVRLVDAPPSGRMTARDRARISDKTIRADLAAWLLDKLEQEGPFRTRTELVALG